MKIAVTYENGEVFQHFGHTEEMKFYEVEDGKVTTSQVVSTNGSGHSALAGFLVENGVNALICGGIGGGAKNALAEAGIDLYPGVSGNADQAVEAFLQGTLSYNPAEECAHHKGSHGEDHHCGEHGCGSHGCGSGGCGSHGCGQAEVEVDYVYHNETGEVVEINQTNFKKEVLNHGYLIVMDFWADWCGPCKMLSPVVDELCKEISDVKFVKVNVDQNQELASMFGITNIPALVFLKANTITDILVGYRPKEELAEAIQRAKVEM